MDSPSPPTLGTALSLEERGHIQHRSGWCPGRMRRTSDCSQDQNLQDMQHKITCTEIIACTISKASQLQRSLAIPNLCMQLQCNIARTWPRSLTSSFSIAASALSMSMGCSCCCCCCCCGWSWGCVLGAVVPCCLRCSEAGSSWLLSGPAGANRKRFVVVEDTPKISQCLYAPGC